MPALRTSVWLVASALAVALASAATLAQQDRGARSFTASIAGQVIDAVSSQPIPGAFLNFGPGGGQVQTDAGGNFVGANLPAGRRTLVARKVGYVGGAFGMRALGTASQEFDLAEAEHATGIVLRLWKACGLSGVVTDERGMPMPGIEVTAFPVGVIAGRLGIQSGRRATTDGRGIYQIANLTPGRYVISEFSGAAGSSGRAGGGGALQQMLDYPRIFFPDALAASDATVIDLAPGDARTDVHFALRARPTFRVAGSVPGLPAGLTGVSVDLIRDQGATGIWSDLSTATATLNESGAFSFPRVPPGRYVARLVVFPSPGPQPAAVRLWQTATAGSLEFARDPSIGPSPTLAVISPEPTWWGQAAVVVTDSPLAGVAIQVQRGARIKGAIMFDGLGAKPSTEGLQQSAIGVVAPDGRDLPTFQVARIEGDRSFTTVGLPPGTYALLPLAGLQSLTGGPPTWPDTWSSVRTSIEGRDQPGELIHLGRDDVMVTLTMTERPTELSGVVKDEAGVLRPDASIYIFRADRSLWTTGAPAREVRPNRRGEYYADLPGGEYYVVASVTAPVLWKEASSLDQLARSATVVRLMRGDKRTLDLVLR